MTLGPVGQGGEGEDIGSPILIQIEASEAAVPHLAST